MNENEEEQKNSQYMFSMVHAPKNVGLGTKRIGDETYRDKTCRLQNALATERVGEKEYRLHNVSAILIGISTCQLQKVSAVKRIVTAIIFYIKNFQLENVLFYLFYENIKSLKGRCHKIRIVF
jgi:hypothetical protein